MASVLGFDKKYGVKIVPTKESSWAGVRDKRVNGELDFAQAFPTGTHAMWLNYWLAAHGINPVKDVKMIVVPPPQMVANTRCC